MTLGDLAKDEFFAFILEPADEHYGWINSEYLWPPVGGIQGEGKIGQVAFWVEEDKKIGGSKYLIWNDVIKSLYIGLEDIQIIAPETLVVNKQILVWGTPDVVSPKLAFGYGLDDCYFIASDSDNDSHFDLITAHHSFAVEETLYPNIIKFVDGNYYVQLNLSLNTYPYLVEPLNNMLFFNSDVYSGIDFKRPVIFEQWVVFDKRVEIGCNNTNQVFEFEVIPQGGLKIRNLDYKFPFSSGEGYLYRDSEGNITFRSCGGMEIHGNEWHDPDFATIDHTHPQLHDRLHNLLSSDDHPDTITASPSAGDLIVGQKDVGLIKWKRFSKSVQDNDVLKSTTSGLTWAKVNFNELAGILSDTQHGTRGANLHSDSHNRQHSITSTLDHQFSGQGNYVLQDNGGWEQKGIDETRDFQDGIGQNHHIIVVGGRIMEWTVT